VKAPMPKITILGTTHNVQGVELYQAPKLDDREYRMVLDRLFGGIDFVIEEASGLGPTTAEQLALERLGDSHYLDVDPPASQRRAYGLQEDAQQRELIELDDRRTDCVIFQHIETQLGREKVWVSRINGTVWRNALLVCGFLHALSVAAKL
jgi:hypothetical protein